MFFFVISFSARLSNFVLFEGFAQDVPDALIEYDVEKRVDVPVGGHDHGDIGVCCGYVIIQVKRVIAGQLDFRYDKIKIDRLELFHGVICRFAKLDVYSRSP